MPLNAQKTNWNRWKKNLDAYQNHMEWGGGVSLKHEYPPVHITRQKHQQQQQHTHHSSPCQPGGDEKAAPVTFWGEVKRTYVLGKPQCSCDFGACSRKRQLPSIIFQELQAGEQAP